MIVELKFGDRGTVSVNDDKFLVIELTGKGKLFTRDTIRDMYDTIFRYTDIIKVNIPTWDHKAQNRMRKLNWAEKPPTNGYIHFFYTPDIWKKFRKRYTWSYTNIKQELKSLKYRKDR